MDDWEENEEFRAIEGLEGKYCPVQNFIVTLIIQSKCMWTYFM